MKNGVIQLEIDKDLISLFIHKPYNFKLDSVKEEERIKQYKEIENSINYSFKKIIGSKQIHSNNVTIVDKNNINSIFENVDGLVTNLKGIALVTYVADCQSILIYDTKNKVIGNVHSGWKGTLSRISTNAINLMINHYNSNPKDIKIYISPSIHKCHFEVNEDVKELFVNEFKELNIDELIEEKNDKYYVDTVELNKRILENLGIKKENILSSELCSMCENYIHSYRNDKPNDGRNITLICKK